MAGKIDQNFTIRAARTDDLNTVVDLINQAAMADTGTMGTTHEDKLNEWGLPQFNMATDTLLVLTPGGRAAGFIELWDSELHVRHYLWGGCTLTTEARASAIT